MRGRSAYDTFNLIHAPWLPVRRRSDAVEFIPPWRITDLDDGDPFVALAWPRPDFNGAAHEFLIGLLSTAAAPVDEGGWEDWWRAPPAPDILKDRFDVVAHAFELDGPGARFLQDLDPLEGAEDKEVSALLIDAPGKQTLRNNADLFVKRGGTAVLGRAAAAMALFTMNAYAPEGGRGHRVSLRGGGPLTTLVIANDTLWGRLWPNVETAEQIRRRATDSALADDTETVFPWLGLTRTSQNARLWHQIFRGFSASFDALLRAESGRSEVTDAWCPVRRYRLPPLARHRRAKRR